MENFFPVGGGGCATPRISYVGTCVSRTAVKGMVFRQFSLGQGIEIRQFWSRIGCHFPGQWPVNKWFSRTGFFTSRGSIVKIETLTVWCPKTKGFLSL